MNLEKSLRQFWRCVDAVSAREDENAKNDRYSHAFYFQTVLTDKNVILSGMRLEYDVKVSGAPAFLAFDIWDLRNDELQPTYYPTGDLIEIKPAKNGFIAVTSDEDGLTTYTFKKTSVDPFRRFEQKQFCKREPRLSKKEQ